LTSVFDGGGGQNQTLAALPPAVNPMNKCPRADVDILEERKISCPYWDSNTGSSSPYPSQLTDYTLLALLQKYLHGPSGSSK